MHLRGQVQERHTAPSSSTDSCSDRRQAVATGESQTQGPQEGQNAAHLLLTEPRVSVT